MLIFAALFYGQKKMWDFPLTYSWEMCWHFKWQLSSSSLQKVTHCFLKPRNSSFSYWFSQKRHDTHHYSQYRVRMSDLVQTRTVLLHKTDCEFYNSISVLFKLVNMCCFDSKFLKRKIVLTMFSAQFLQHLKPLYSISYFKMPDNFLVYWCLKFQAGLYLFPLPLFKICKCRSFPNAEK